MPVRLPFRALGAVAAALVVVGSFGAVPQHGSSVFWVFLAGLVVFCAASVAYLFAPRLNDLGGIALLLVAGLALISVYWAQPVGPPVGMFLVAAFATLRPPLRAMLVATAVLAATFCAVQLPSGHETPVTAAAVIAGMALFAGVGVLLRSEREQREQVTSLLRELEVAQAAERQASELAARAVAAREVHDVLAHSLSGLIIQLEAARLQADRVGTDPDLRTSVEGALRSARSGLDEAKRAVAALRGDASPGPADLPALIEEHRLTTGAPTVFHISGEPRELSSDAGLTVYRATQEALSNVRKHTRGAAVDVRLTWGQDDLTLVIANPVTEHTEPHQGMGLTGLGERVRALHGTLRTGYEGDHFVVRLTIPLTEPEPPTLLT